MDDFNHLADLDRASEEELIKILGLVWGLRRAPTGNAPRVYDWIYEQMTDAARLTYPRELLHLLEGARVKELELLKTTPPPEDRLFRVEALDAGLTEASRERCKALRTEEYKFLEPFLEKLRGIAAQGSLKPMRDAWKRTLSDQETDFNAFLNLLETIGLLTIERSSPRRLTYKFADIYIDGFGLLRATSSR